MINQYFPKYSSGVDIQPTAMRCFKVERYIIDGPGQIPTTLEEAILSLDLRLERAFEHIELVTGVGNRDAGRLCVMSLVACLAGEAHTDSPACASPLIRAFAISLNDNMPHDVRQRLKPFAPRIIGTNDGKDALRANLLRYALIEEILPRQSRRQAPRPRRFAVPLWRLWSFLDPRRQERETESMMNQAAALSNGANLERAVATAGTVGRQLARAAREAPDPRDAEWLWNQSISILDRLCNNGTEQRTLASSAAWAQRITSATATRTQQVRVRQN